MAGVVQVTLTDHEVEELIRWYSRVPEVSKTVESDALEAKLIGWARSLGCTTDYGKPCEKGACPVPPVLPSTCSGGLCDGRTL